MAIGGNTHTMRVNAVDCCKMKGKEPGRGGEPAAAADKRASFTMSKYIIIFKISGTEYIFFLYAVT